MPAKGDLVQGTLEMLILKTLALQPMHGFGISVRIEQMSNGIFHVIPGSLFPALNRLEREGRIKGEWRSTENNRRGRYYMLTELGRKALKDEIRAWERQVNAVARIGLRLLRPERQRHHPEHQSAVQPEETVKERDKLQVADRLAFYAKA